MSGEDCRCQIVGWTRDPYEPHIPSQPEWEQADDCPLHPLPAPVPSEVAETTAGEHHPACYQSTGVPDHLPAGLCDCKVLRMLDAAETTAGERRGVAVAKVSAASQEGLDRALQKWRDQGYAVAAYEEVALPLEGTNNAEHE